MLSILLRAFFYRHHIFVYIGCIVLNIFMWHSNAPIITMLTVYACISLSLQKWDIYVLKVFRSLKCFIDIEIRCGIFLFLHLFHWHLNQVIQINRTDRNSDSIQLWMFAICYWSFQCLRWRLWHGNFIPNNCWQNCTTNPNPNQTQPNPIDIIYIRLFIYVCIWYVASSEMDPESL